MPFLHTSSTLVSLSDNSLCLTLNSEEVKQYKAQESEYLFPGTYRFVGKNTFFLTYKTVAASKLSYIYITRTVDNSSMLPARLLEESPSPIATMTVVFTLTKNDYDTLVNDSMNKQISLERESLCLEMTELQQSKALASSLRRVFGDDFSIMCNQKLLSIPVCRYATSQADLAIFHNEKYVYDGTLIGFYCAGEKSYENEDEESEETDSDTYVLLGMAGEDKHEGRDVKQVLAGMLLLATKLGVDAIQEEKFFSRAVMFGQYRMVSEDNSYLFKLMMDFKRHTTSVTKGKYPISTSHLLKSIETILKSPEILKELK